MVLSEVCILRLVTEVKVLWKDLFRSPILCILKAEMLLSLSMYEYMQG